MANQPQSSLVGARAGSTTPQKPANMANPRATTPVPQEMRAPTQLNANAMNNQVQNLQNQSYSPAGAVNSASQNPNNRYYSDGGDVLPPSDPEIQQRLKTSQLDPRLVDRLAAALKGEPVMNKEMHQDNSETDTYGDSHPRPQRKPTTQDSSGSTEKMTKDYLKDRAVMTGARPTGPDDTNTGGNYAKGGEVHSMPLKAVLKMLMSHPEVMGNGAKSEGQPMKSTDMNRGGIATAKKGASEAHNMGRGLLTMNDDAGTYAEGGEVLGNSAGIRDGKSPIDKGLLKMATGGSATNDMESDNITGYAADGTPIIKNEDGTTSAGNINDLLGRPKNASTLAMAKGGDAEDTQPPPGSNSEEIADDIPARLSQGEFVFSADVTRYYGLRLLNMMMEHARSALSDMNSEGTIKHPGSTEENNGSEEDGGHFLQDEKPSENNDPDMDYGEEDPEGAKKITGILAACDGGIAMATGGEVNGEEMSLAKGGSVYNTEEYPVGRKNMISAHPHAGDASPAVGYAIGGAVSPVARSLFPKPSENKIPGLKSPKIKETLPKEPKFSKGGLLNKAENMSREINARQPEIGA